MSAPFEPTIDAQKPNGSKAPLQYAELAPHTPRMMKFTPMNALAVMRKPMNWLIKGFMECGTHGLVFSPPESGKTLMLMDIGYHVATGMPWYGNRVKQGAVFYICGEGQTGIGRRANAWLIEHDIDPTSNTPFFCSDIPASLSDSEAAEMISHVIRDLCQQFDVVPVLIIIDTLARSFGAGDENSNRDMGRVIENIDSAFIHGMGAAVLVAHHTGHQEVERPRAASALIGALDVMYRISKDDQDCIRIESKKCKDFKRMEPKQMKLVVRNLGYQDEDGDEMTGATVREMEYVETAAPDGLSVNQRLAVAVLIEEYNRIEATGAHARNGEPGPMISLDHWREKLRDRWSRDNKGKPYDDLPANQKTSARTAMNKVVADTKGLPVVRHRPDGIHVYPACKEPLNRDND